MEGQGTAMIVLDHKGKCFFAATTLDMLCINATMAEAKGLRWALMKLQELELDAIMIETDSKLVASCFLQ